jgi:transcriptional regulator with XRE-family HTH domain
MRKKEDRPLRVGGMLRRWRLANDFGLEETADKIGINYKSLYRLERGATLDMPSMIKIITWLFGFEEGERVKESKPKTIRGDHYA